jgi:hypothetical protein
MTTTIREGFFRANLTLSLISGQFEIGLSCLLRPSTTGAEDYEGPAVLRR